MKEYYIYIMASKRNGTLYIGMTDDLKERVYTHKHDIVKGFTSKYHIHTLVYYEIYTDINITIAREKQLKWWKREWKIKLIEKMNPEWKDLYDRL